MGKRARAAHTRTRTENSGFLKAIVREGLKGSTAHPETGNAMYVGGRIDAASVFEIFS